MRPSSTESTETVSWPPKYTCKLRQFNVGDSVFVKNFSPTHPHPAWLPGCIMSVCGPLSYHVCSWFIVVSCLSVCPTIVYRPSSHWPYPSLFTYLPTRQSLWFSRWPLRQVIPADPCSSTISCTSAATETFATSSSPTRLVASIVRGTRCNILDCIGIRNV